MTEVASVADFRVRYTKDSDVLYVSRGAAAPARSHEGDPGLVWRYDARSGDLIGLTVIDFVRYWRPRRSQLVDQIAAKFAISAADAGAMVDQVRG